MFCTNCGKNVNNDEKFCSYCGHPQKKTNVKPAQTTAARGRLFNRPSVIETKNNFGKEKAKPNFVLSYIALGVGILALVTVTQHGAGSVPVGGMAMILGALAYQSAKERGLGLKNNTAGRWCYEIILLIIILGVVVLQNNFAMLINNDPIPNLFIPAGALIAYVVAINTKYKPIDTVI